MRMRNTKGLLIKKLVIMLEHKLGRATSIVGEALLMNKVERALFID